MTHSDCTAAPGDSSLARAPAAPPSFALPASSAPLHSDEAGTVDWRRSFGGSRPIESASGSRIHGWPPGDVAASVLRPYAGLVGHVRSYIRDTTRSRHKTYEGRLRPSWAWNHVGLAPRQTSSRSSRDYPWHDRPLHTWVSDDGHTNRWSFTPAYPRIASQRQSNRREKQSSWSLEDRLVRSLITFVQWKRWQDGISAYLIAMGEPVAPKMPGAADWAMFGCRRTTW